MNSIALAKIAAAPRPSAEQILSTRIAIAKSNRRGGDLRGNSKDRARRVAKLLAEFGDGVTCPCVYCDKVLDSATLTQDKIFTGDQGGRYIMANLLPACMECNRKRSDAVIDEFVAEAKAAIAAAEAQRREG